MIAISFSVSSFFLMLIFATLSFKELLKSNYALILIIFFLITIPATILAIVTLYNFIIIKIKSRFEFREEVQDHLSICSDIRERIIITLFFTIIISLAFFGGELKEQNNFYPKYIIWYLASYMMFMLNAYIVIGIKINKLSAKERDYPTSFMSTKME